MKLNDINVGDVFTLKDYNTKIGKCNETYPMDQRYHWYLPVFNNGEWIMLNSYQLPKIYGNTEENLVRLLNLLKTKPNYCVREAYSFYYSCVFKLTDENINLFKKEFSLDEVEQTTKVKGCYYDKEDVFFNVKLYSEHNYPYGITLVKKNAKVNKIRKLMAEYNNSVVNYNSFIIPEVKNYNINSFKKVAQELNAEDNKLVKEVEIIEKALTQARELYFELTKDLTYIDNRSLYLRDAWFDDNALN